jgi:hypothetical protein
VSEFNRSPEEMSLLTKLLDRSSRPLPQLDHAHPHVRELKTALRALDALPLTNKEEVGAWYAASGAFQKRLRTDWNSIYDSLPHELGHYLSDADIRAKDSAYADYQRKLLTSLLAPEEAIQLLRATEQGKSE